QETLAIWAGLTDRGLTEKDRKDSTYYHDLIKTAWVDYFNANSDQFAKYDDAHTFWNYMVHNGGGWMSAKKAKPASMNGGVVSKAASAINTSEGTSAKSFEIQFYQKTAIGDGSMAGNPWLQEMPDPITTVTWDNYVTMNPADAESYTTNYDQVHPVSILKVKLGDKEIKLPVIVQPGQAKGTAGIAYGYGRAASFESDSDKVKIGKGAFATTEFGDYERDENGKIKPLGASVFQLLSIKNGAFVSEVSGAEISDTGNSHLIAATQTHHTIMGRHSIVKETSLDFYVNGWKETDYGIPSNREGFNPQHTLPVHEDVGGKRDENGRLVFDDNGNPIGDDVIDANDRSHISNFDLWNEHPVE